MKTIKGKETGKGVKIAIVVARFNYAITERLLEACCDELVAKGVRKSAITVVWVPGAFEIPLVAAQLAKKRDIKAVICLGAVIKGVTDHYEHVARESVRGLMDLALSSGKPIIYEILTCRTLKHAQDRAKIKGYNKGRVAALVALETIDIIKQIGNNSKITISL